MLELTQRPTLDNMQTMKVIEDSVLNRMLSSTPFLQGPEFYEEEKTEGL